MQSKDDKNKAETFDRDKVVNIINSVILKIRDQENEEIKSLHGELTNLNSIIEDARREISTSTPGDIQNKYIPTAADELDAVVKATEQATGDIMDAVEIIETLAENQLEGEVAEKVAGAVTKIYEACSFQDITGQRINKVTSALQQIESKVIKLLDIVGKKVPGMTDGELNRVSINNPDEHALAQGPQMPGRSITQDDIDKLLEDFE